MTAESAPAVTRSRGNVRRELTLAVVTCLAGALLVLVAVGRTWASVRVDATALLPARTVGVPGSEIAAGFSALALVGLAGVVAVAATRRWGRLAVGVLLALDGTGVVLLVLDRLRSLSDLALASDRVRSSAGSVSSTGWPYVALLGGLLLAAAGIAVAVRGPRWAALGRRYEPPAPSIKDPVPVPADRRGSATDAGAVAARAERELWEALDRGEDPTSR